MITIWKYTLNVTDSFSIEMPVNARILCVQTQDDEPVLWAIVNPESPTEVRAFSIYCTGQPDLEMAGKSYIGTFQLLLGEFVGHLFENLDVSKI